MAIVGKNCIILSREIFQKYKEAFPWFKILLKFVFLVIADWREMQGLETIKKYFCWITWNFKSICDSENI